MGENWRHSSARLSNRKPPPQRPPPNLSCDSCGSCDSCDSCAHNTQAKPTQLNGQTAAAASTHICRGLTITNHITFPIHRQPRFGPTCPTLSGCHRCKLRHLTAATAMAADHYHERLGKKPNSLESYVSYSINKRPLDNRQAKCSHPSCKCSNILIHVHLTGHIAN